MPRDKISDILMSSRQLRRKRLFLKGIFFIAAVFILTGGCISLFYMPKFKITGITIEGALVLDKEQVREEITNILKEKFFGIIPYDNIFIFPKKEIISDLLRNLPIIKNVSINRNFPNNISLLIDEREPEAIWCLNQNPPSATSTQAAISDNFSLNMTVSCAFIDGGGFVFGIAPFFSGSIFLKFFDERKEPAGIGKNILSADEFRKLLLFGNLLLQNNIEVLKITVKDDGFYEINTGEGWKILMNDKTDANSAFSNLKLVLDSNIKEKRPQLDYLDLRFGNKVYFKYK
jgi:hypothetical protein